MCGEILPGDRRLAHPLVEPPAHVGRARAGGRGGYEQRLLLARRARAHGGRLQIAAQGALGGLADRHQAGLLALAGDAGELGLEVDAAEIERDDLLGAQAARVGELEQRPVADLERGPRRDPVEQAGDLVAARAPAAGASPASSAGSRSAGLASATPVVTRWP